VPTLERIRATLVDGAVPGGWVGTFSNGVEFIQWTEETGYLVGQAELVYTTSAQPLQPVSTNLAFSGIRNGSNISLTASSGVTWTGTVAGDSLTLVIPNQDGTLATDSFYAGTADDYNTALASFQSSLASQTAAAGMAQLTAMCAAGAAKVQGHDATVLFTGTSASYTCQQFLNQSPPDAPYEVANNNPAALDLACIITGPDIVVTVRDSGYMHIAFNDLCPFFKSWLNAPDGSLGVTTQNVTFNHGATVVSVAPNSPAWCAGMQPGDLIEQFGGLSINQASDMPTADQYYSAGSTVQIRYIRGPAVRIATVVLGQAPSTGSTSPQACGS